MRYARAHHEIAETCRRSDPDRDGRHLGGGIVGMARADFVAGADLGSDRCWRAYAGRERLDGPGQPRAVDTSTAADEDRDDDGLGCAATARVKTAAGKHSGIAGAAIIAAERGAGGSSRAPGIRADNPGGHQPGGR
jgi:hypothetical protein